MSQEQKITINGKALPPPSEEQGYYTRYGYKMNIIEKEIMNNKITIKDFIAATFAIAFWIIIWNNFAGQEFKQFIFKKENLIGMIIGIYVIFLTHPLIKEKLITEDIDCVFTRLLCNIIIILIEVIFSWFIYLLVPKFILIFT